MAFLVETEKTVSMRKLQRTLAQQPMTVSPTSLASSFHSLGTNGWNCKYGESCRFFDIPGAHPDSGEFHQKKNYYDSFHNAPLEQEANSSGW
ncbi:hypothetical protein QFC22_000083 [Naganishia vaughanmartiniae]|uniref:Uncharacterized protein n=1 Tax=Naganishia vaughanmartiniae TaxID=1424756 RepID=A0ACC2XP28_9TREE|nr:hypothetical protein QFC22_000083 [Naganishia vaughanmartiniae]